jgi:hypothetical protein
MHSVNDSLMPARRPAGARRGAQRADELRKQDLRWRTWLRAIEPDAGGLIPWKAWWNARTCFGEVCGARLPSARRCNCAASMSAEGWNGRRRQRVVSACRSALG